MTILEKAKTLKTDKEIINFIETLHDTKHIGLLDIETLLLEVGLRKERILDLTEQWKN